MTPSGRVPRTVVWFLVPTALLILTFVMSLTLGALNIALRDVFAWVVGTLPADDLSARVLAGVRLPRTLTAVAVGAVLGVAGAALQGIHRTQIVDAHLLLLSTVYRHPIDVVEHPKRDGLLVLPRSVPASPDDHGPKAEI